VSFTNTDRTEGKKGKRRGEKDVNLEQMREAKSEKFVVIQGRRGKR